MRVDGIIHCGSLVLDVCVYIWVCSSVDICDYMYVCICV